MDFRRSIVDDSEIKTAIAKDLNTPPAILARMAENEFKENKIGTEIRRILEVYCPSDSDWADTNDDQLISRLKDEVLTPEGINIDLDLWIEAILNESLSLSEIRDTWRLLLPQLSSELLERVINTIRNLAIRVREELEGNLFWTSVVAALLENQQTPEILREQLWLQYQKPPETYSNSYHRDTNLRLALAINPSVSIERRKDYLRQIVNSYQKMSDSIARNPTIPQDLLLELADINAGIRQAIARNPNAPYSLLLELSKDSNSTTRNWVAENPNTPLDILLTLTNDGALKNPNFPPLEIYRVTLASNLSNERQNASELIANLPLKTKLSLTQVVEGNELPAKLSIARDLQTPIEILERLAQDPNEDVRSTVASNRNLPLATLLQLANDPSSNIRMNIARNSNTPPEILAQLAFTDDPGGWIADSLVKNQNTSVETLEYLGVEQHVVNAYNKNTPPTALAAQVDYALTQHSKTKINIFELLHGDFECAKMPASSLIKLATNSEELIRARVALHRNTPHVVLEQLSNDKSYSPILWNLAINPNSSPALLAKLLKENYETVAGHMAERRIIPPSIMGRLLEHESEYVRTQIVYRDNLSLELAKQVIKSETHSSVLLSLAYNQILTSDLIFDLLQHPSLNSDICIALLVHPNLTIDHWQQLANNQSEAVRLTIASRENTPIDILVILADDRELQVRRAIASNLQTPSDLLVKLAADLEAEVRTRIAANPQTPVPTLETLATDASVEVRRSVLNNPQTPASIRQDLEDIFGRNPVATTIDTLRGLPRIYDPANDDVITILTEYARSNNAFVRLVSLLHPLMPSEVIERASRSACWSDRYAVAKNSAAPDLVRQSLSLDSNRIVRAISQVVT
jgi:Leucine rich repeat variant